MDHIYGAGYAAVYHVNIHAGLVYHNKTHSVNQPIMASLPFNSQSHFYFLVTVMLSIIRTYWCLR